MIADPLSPTQHALEGETQPLGDGTAASVRDRGAQLHAMQSPRFERVIGVCAHGGRHDPTTLMLRRKPVADAGARVQPVDCMHADTAGDRPLDRDCGLDTVVEGELAFSPPEVGQGVGAGPRGCPGQPPCQVLAIRGDQLVQLISIRDPQPAQCDVVEQDTLQHDRVKCFTAWASGRRPADQAFESANAEVKRDYPSVIASAGQTTVSTCQHCGFESPAGLRFCGSCGAQLPEEVVQRQTRKVVTALFCDVTGSTALGEELDPEILRGVINRYFGVIRSTIERHGGTVEKFVGDAVMAVFGIPVVREDDALRAVRAAAEIRERLPAVAEQVGVELRFRTGVNTGTVLMSEGENFATGDAVNVAARLEQAAAPGEIVIGPETLRLVRDAVVVEALEPLTLKGKSDPVHAHRLISVDPLAAGVARHLEAELVGRERELALLKESWERVVRESGCHLFTLLGSAGVGKSRLVAELLAGVGDEVLVLRGRCLSYGEGITFWPLVEALVPVGEPAAAVLERLTVGGAAVPEELFWDVRRLLEALAAQRPMVLYLDDLQWSEGMLLDLIDHVVDLSRGAPILVLCTARPELLEDRPELGRRKVQRADRPAGATGRSRVADAARPARRRA